MYGWKKNKFLGYINLKINPLARSDPEVKRGERMEKM
jgi:hypothetical protein